MACNSPAVLIELQEFLRESAKKKFDWVSCNCGFWVCEWIKLVTGNDPVADIRGRFKTASRFRRHVNDTGGNEAFSRSIAERAGLVETNNPNIGDVGLVATGDGATMAIKLDADKWACKTLDGIAIAPFGQIAAWRL
jgi:hypothetical protein